MRGLTCGHLGLIFWSRMVEKGSLMKDLGSGDLIKDLKLVIYELELANLVFKGFVWGLRGLIRVCVS